MNNIIKMNNLIHAHSLSTVSDNGNWYNDFADKLISENFLLTALEFHAELIESGKELPKLKEFFSNPGNFEYLASNKPEVACSAGLPRSSSQATLDSLDLTRYSEDGERSNDDKVAVLEFELRKARETIIALRANLTVAAETDNKQKSEEKSKEAEVLNKSQKSTIKPHEQRALNFLINEYLLLHGYKLTSITFSDENESQDFDDWDDVGLNVGRPVELLSLYRKGLKASGFSNYVSTSDFHCQVYLDNEVQENLKARINELEGEISKLTTKITAMNSEFSKRFQGLLNQENIELESHHSLSPETDYFEIIENIKSREESETKSDQSNSDWTKIGERFKKENIELKSDDQANYELMNAIEKSNAVFHENLNDISEDINRDKLNEDSEDKIKISNLDNITLINSFHETMIDALDNDINEEDQIKENYNGKCRIKKEHLNSLFNLNDNSRNPLDKYMDEFLLHCDMNVPIYSCNHALTEWFYETDPNYLTIDQIVDIISDSVPKIVPNIILNKREEITPLLILAICLNSRTAVRDKLLNLLFNLKKKPQEEERRFILSALSTVAQLMGSSTVENEVLPQCWEQISHKYIERRMLVAESCFILAPFVSEAIRNSLVISIIKQLLQDREEKVRKSAVNILALLIALTSDEDKYTQILDICLNVLNDESLEVLKSVTYVLYPVLAKWTFSLRRIQSDLFKKLLIKLKEEKLVCIISVIDVLLPFLVLTVADSDYLLNDTSKNIPSPDKRSEFSKLYKGLCDPLLFYKGSLSEVMGLLDSYTSNSEFETCNWPEMEWIWEIFITTLLETGNLARENSEFLIGLVSCFRNLCLGLGKNITNYKIKPFLLKRMETFEKLIVAGEDCEYSIIPLYLAGVLSISIEYEKEMDVTLRKLICILPLCGTSLTPLQVSIELLSRHQQWHILILNGIWEGVTHQRSLVRSASAKLFQSLISNIPENLISTKVLPALITLSSDPEINVRVNTIPTLGMLINCKDKNIKDKVYMTLQGILQESSNLHSNAIVIQFAKTIGKIYEICFQHFREEVIIQLYSALSSHSKTTELVEVLTEVFAIVSFSQSPLSYHCISTSLLPGLRCLENACSQLNLSFRDRIDSMIKEVERRGATSKEIICKSAVSIPASESKRLLPNSVSTQVVVEDVKNRVTKIFHTKPHTLQNVSGIFKKKS